MKKQIITLLLAVLPFACSIAKVKPKVITTLKGYPSGAIDEYHFHAGTAVVKGRFAGGQERDFSTFNVTGTDLFSIRVLSEQFVWNRMALFLNRLVSLIQDGSISVVQTSRQPLLLWATR